MPNTVLVPGVGLVQFPDSMSDDQVNTASAKLWSDAKAKLAAANKGYDENKALNENQNKSIVGHIADQFTPGKMFERGVEGAKGAAEGLVGGAAGTVYALGAAPLYIADAALTPRVSLEKAKDALNAGAAVAYGAGQDPMAASNKVWDTFAQYASDPRNVGRAVGAYYGGKAVIESPLGQRAWEYAKNIASDTVNKIPGVARTRAGAPPPGAPPSAPPGAPPGAPPSPPPGATGGPAPSPVPPPVPPGAPPPTAAPPVAPPTAAPVTPAAAPPTASAPAGPTPLAQALGNNVAPPSPAVRAAMPVIRNMTVDQFNAVSKLPVEERQLYIKLRQVGDTHAEAVKTLDFARESQALRDQAQTARAMSGTSKAASDLYGTSSPEAQAKVRELAPGPSRVPLNMVSHAMDERYRQLVSDPRAAWLLPLLGGAGLGALAQRQGEQ